MLLGRSISNKWDSRIRLTTSIPSGRDNIPSLLLKNLSGLFLNLFQIIINHLIGLGLLTPKRILNGMILENYIKKMVEMVFMVLGN